MVSFLSKSCAFGRFRFGPGGTEALVSTSEQPTDQLGTQDPTRSLRTPFRTYGKSALSKTLHYLFAKERRTLAVLRSLSQISTDGPNYFKQENDSGVRPLLLNPGLWWDRFIEQPPRTGSVRDPGRSKAKNH